MDTIEIGKSWEETEDFEVVILGGGPKGLAQLIELERSGIKNVVLVDSSPTTGYNWSSSRMGNDLLVTPKPVEITRYKDLSFDSFLQGKYEYLTPSYIPLTKDFYEYQQWLRSKTEGVRTGVKIDHIALEGDSVYLTPHKGKNIRAKNVVLATGMVGYGNREFAYYPPYTTDSDNIQHYPGKLVSTADLKTYVGTSKSIAIIGGNLAGLDVVKAISDSEALEAIYIIAEGDILAKGGIAIESLNVDECRKAVTRGMIRELWRNKATLQKHFYPHSPIQEIEEKTGCVSIKLGEEQLNVDKVILATGFQYDFKALPFLKGLGEHSIQIASDSKRPHLDHWQRLQNGFGQPLPIYAMGDAAGEHCRRLPSTLEEVRKITASILGNLKAKKYK